MKCVCSRSVKVSTDRTPEVQAIAQMFGIGLDDAHEISLYKDLEIEVGGGKLVAIVGESGAGKTSLLRDIESQCGGAVRVLKPATSLADLPEIPIVSILSGTLESRLWVLNSAGLSEPFIWIRRPSHLSDGQKYRFLLAMALESAATTGVETVLFVDEFCAVLDRVTAKAVANQCRKAARDGLGIVIATTHDDILEDLNPDTLVRMRVIDEPTVKRKE